MLTVILVAEPFGQLRATMQENLAACTLMTQNSREREAAMVIDVLAALGALVVLFALLDVVDLWLFRAWKRSLPGWGRIRGSWPLVRERDDPRRNQGS